MIVTFHNVTLHIEADTPRAAYDHLTDVASTGFHDWITDTYSTDDGEERDTQELFPASILCQHCGSSREHVEMMALVAGISDPFCCEGLI